MIEPDGPHAKREGLITVSGLPQHVPAFVISHPLVILDANVLPPPPIQMAPLELPEPGAEHA